MATEDPIQTSDDNKDNSTSSSNSGQIIHPTDEEAIKKQLSQDKLVAHASEDMLAELAAKTAELAKKVHGKEDPKEHVLQLDNESDVTPEQIEIAAEQNNPSKLAEYNQKNDLKNAKSTANPAVELIREKLGRLYKKEPDAGVEAAETVSIKNRSKHQEFMYQLTTSGKSLANIQTQWHTYYVSLPDEEKHIVWQEFYLNQNVSSKYSKHVKSKDSKAKEKREKIHDQTISSQDLLAKSSPRSIADIKSKILNTVSGGGRLKPIHHIKSALFGLGLASIVGLVVAFFLFNQVIIAPFISPSHSISVTPIIGDINTSVSEVSKIIIPKINVEAPVVFGLDSVDEKTIQKSLEQGVVHYAASPEPGQKGNSVIVGHSSNNIFNAGKYKFAFVLLRRLSVDDTFFVQKDGVRYTYKIFERKIVQPDDVSVLGPSSRDNTMTLITCDPPGTSLRRLIIIGEQISPDPVANIAASPTVQPPADGSVPGVIPSAPPSLLRRILNIF